MYSDLGSPTPVSNQDWDILILQPDPFLPDDGVYDALALTNSPSLFEVFSLSFVWQGTGAPGDQPFALYDEAFNTIATGNTTTQETSVPEPTTISLLGLGILAMIGSRKK